MSPSSLTDVPAPAKLNLFLHVVGRRADGYHLLQSLFVLIDWCDTPAFRTPRRRASRAPRSRRSAARRRPVPARGAGAAGGERHALRRRHLDRQAAARPAPAWAAAARTRPRTLLALNRLWGLDWPRGAVAALGARARRRRAVLRRRPQCLGRRHRRAAHAVDLPPHGSSCVKPAAGVETRAIFERPGMAAHAQPAILSGFLADADSWASVGVATTCSRRPRLCPTVAQRPQLLQARSATAA